MDAGAVADTGSVVTDAGTNADAASSCATLFAASFEDGFAQGWVPQIAGAGTLSVEGGALKASVQDKASAELQRASPIARPKVRLRYRLRPGPPPAAAFYYEPGCALRMIDGIGNSATIHLTADAAGFTLGCAGSKRTFLLESEKWSSVEIVANVGNAKVLAGVSVDATTQELACDLPTPSFSIVSARVQCGILYAESGAFTAEIDDVSLEECSL